MHVGPRLNTCRGASERSGGGRGAKIISPRSPPVVFEMMIIVKATDKIVVWIANFDLNFGDLTPKKKKYYCGNMRHGKIQISGLDYYGFYSFS